ncbi:MAG TPA: nucleotidyltransferase domain-containing protein [bacterium]|nr:nucleotidyltransferase domain-containing protein [bacterium]
MIAADKIQRITDTIVRTYRPERMIIFGSCARDEQAAGSDLDIMVISDREKHLPAYKRGLKTRLALPEPDVAKDILFYTHEEIERWKDVPLSFVATVLREGKVVYEQR